MNELSFHPFLIHQITWRFVHIVFFEIFFRALINKSIAGLFFVSRIIKLRERVITRPGRLIKENRTAFILFDNQAPSIDSFFIITFRLSANIMIHHYAAFSPKSSDGSLPPARSSFITAWASSLLPHLSCSQCISFSPSQSMFVTIPKTL